MIFVEALRLKKRKKTTLYYVREHNTRKRQYINVIRLATPLSVTYVRRLKAGRCCSVLKLRHSPICEHGEYCCHQVSRLFGFSHQDAVRSGVHHPVLLPQEGKTPGTPFMHIFYGFTVLRHSGLTVC